MAWPGNHAGNADAPDNAKIKLLVSRLIEIVGAEVWDRELSRMPFRILRPANFFVLGESQSIHIVYAENGGSPLPIVIIRDTENELPTGTVTGRDAIQLVQELHGWGNCEAITVSRSLLDAPAEHVEASLKAEAHDYIEQVLSKMEEDRLATEVRTLLNLQIVDS